MSTPPKEGPNNMHPRTVEPGSLLPRIRSLLDSFTKAERRLADRVLVDPESAVFSSVTALADAAQVGEATVLRFCRTLGCNGFQEFKLLLSRELVTPEENFTGRPAVEDDLATLRTKVLTANIAALQETASLLNLAQVEKFVEAIIGARRLFFFGVGISALTASDAYSKFLRIGIPCHVVPDPHLGVMNASLLGSGDVAVGFSHSGSTRDTVDILTAARRGGATTIAITAMARSPITKQADVVLLATGPDTPLQGGSLIAKISQLFVVDLVLTAVSLRMRDTALTAAEKTAEAVLTKLY